MIHVSGHRLVFTIQNEIEFKALDKATRVKHPQATFLKRRNRNIEYYRNWDGYTSVVKPAKWKGSGEYSVALGLYAQCIEMEAPGWEQIQEVVQKSIRMNFRFSQRLLTKTLSEKQIEACQTLLSARMVALQFKVGSGKTEVVANAAACIAAVKPDVKILLLVPLARLLHQTYKRIKDDTELKVGIAGDGKLELDANLVVATPHTVTGGNPEITEWMESVDLIVVDEAQYAPSNLWEKAIAMSPRAGRWGLSGKLTYTTAKNRHKELAIEAVFGPLLLDSEAPERRCAVKVVQYIPKSWTPIDKGLPNSIRDGVQAAFKYDGAADWSYGIYRGYDTDGKPNPKVLAVDAKGRVVVDKNLLGIYHKGRKVEKSEMSKNTLVYQTSSDIGLVEHVQRNDWAAALAKTFIEKGEKFLITVQTYRHVDKIMARLKGLPVGVISGDQTGPTNDKALENLNDGMIAGIVATYQGVSTGLDISGLIHLIKLDGQSGEQLLTQQAGRVGRSGDNKPFGYIHIPSDPHNDALKRNSTRAVTYFKRVCDCILEKIELP